MGADVTLTGVKNVLPLALRNARENGFDCDVVELDWADPLALEADVVLASETCCRSFTLWNRSFVSWLL